MSDSISKENLLEWLKKNISWDEESNEIIYLYLLLDYLDSAETCP